MPTKVPKQGTRRSGQGVAPPTLGRPIVKNFDPPRDPWLSGASGEPTAAADTTWNRTTQHGFGEDDVMLGPMGDDEINAFAIVREFVCEFLSEADLISDREDAEEPLEEFSAVATGAVQGYTLPLGMSNRKSKTKKKQR